MGPLPEKIKDSNKLINFKKKMKLWRGGTCICRLCKVFVNGIGFLNSLLVIQNFTTARKSGNILLTYLKAFFVRHSSEYENVG